MRVRTHVAVSTVVSAAVYAASGSPVMTVASFAAGWLIDGDHGLDYLIEHGPRPDIRFFLRTFSDHLYRRARIVLHGWEWPLVCLAVSALLQWHPAPLGLAIGWFHHLLLDQIGNTRHPLAYSLAGRALHAFRYDVFFGPGPGEAM